VLLKFCFKLCRLGQKIVQLLLWEVPVSRLSLIFLYLLTCVCGQAQVVMGDDFKGDADTAVSVLQQWYNSSGLWDTTGWWNAANCVDALEAAIVLNNGGPYLGVISNTFSFNSAGNFLNNYYDDEGWWAEAWIRAYDVSGNVQYLNMAKTIFNDMTNGWGNSCGGGLWWNKSQTYKNAIPNELFLLVASRLHQRTPGDTGVGSYLLWATNEWSWFKSSGMLNGQSLINDGLTTNCLNNGQTTWTYNQGVLLGGLTELYKATGDTNYLDQAEAIANAALKHLTSANVLQEPCETQGGCGGGDVPQFKGIFVRNLACLYDVDHRSNYFGFLFTNAHSVWFNDRNTSNQLGLKWTGTFDSADAARQSSAIMAVSAPAAPSTSLLPFAKAAGDPAFNHSVGRATGALAWTCSPAIASGPNYMLSGPYLASLPIGGHTVHFRMAVDAINASGSNLVHLDVVQNSTVKASLDVPWNAFASPGLAQDFPLRFTNSISGAFLQFRVYWNHVPGAPTLTVSDVTIDGARNWTAANLSHDIGRLDGHNNWEADPVRDLASGYLVRGPGTMELGAGNYSATFELAVDNFNWDNSTVATLSVVDTNSGKALVSRNISRGEFSNTLFRSFDLFFSAVGSGHYDFRTYWDYAPNAPRLTQRSIVLAATGSAAFQPILLTSDSYNQDMVVERGAPHPPVSSTTASMDSGTANTGDSWYEQGYNMSAPTTGLPPAGSTITNQSASDHLYTFAPSYTAPNVACLDSTHSASFVPLSPAPFLALSFLTASGHGPVGVDLLVHHADGSSETGLLTSPDWFFNTPVVWNCQGRVNVQTGTFDNVNSGNPRLYFKDISLTNTISAVTSIDLSLDNGGGEAAIFGVSGVGSPMEVVAPLTLTRSGDLMVLTWSFGHLLQSSNLTGPWIANISASSPFTLVPTNSSAFFRLQ
jgi:predicted alpha-1,6-mannanase (GH76 family)